MDKIVIYSINGGYIIYHGDKYSPLLSPIDVIAVLTSLMIKNNPRSFEVYETLLKTEDEMKDMRKRMDDIIKELNGNI